MVSLDPFHMVNDMLIVFTSNASKRRGGLSSVWNCLRAYFRHLDVQYRFGVPKIEAEDLHSLYLNLLQPVGLQFTDSPEIVPGITLSIQE
jgi:hypothetical protein